MNRVHVRPTAKTRKRRRRRRGFTLLAYVVIVFGLAWYFESRATTTIIFVRHADIDQAMSEQQDAPLNAAGLARAESLADYLDQVDVVAGPDAIYVSQKKRTQQTAAPLASRLGIEPEIADHYDIVGFMKNLLFDHKAEIVLVVSHSDTIAPLIEELHGSKNIAEFAPDEYDRVYIVTIPWFGKVKTLQLSYPAGDIAGDMARETAASATDR
jgi:broad specificity phosphatase PhoE